MVIHGPGSDGWSVVSDPGDVRAGSTPAEVSAAGSGSGSGSSSGSDDQRELEPLRGRPGSLDGDWRGDLEGGGVGGMGYSEEEAAELAQRRQRSFIACPAKCRGATPVAILCLLLVRRSQLASHLPLYHFRFCLPRGFACWLGCPATFCTPAEPRMHALPWPVRGVGPAKHERGGLKRASLTTKGVNLRKLRSSPAREGGPTASASINILELCGDVRV